MQVKDQPALTATSTDTGSFTLAKVPAGEVVLQVSAAGFDAVEVPVKAGRGATTVAIYVTRTAPPPPPPVRLISGLVKGSDGKAVAGASVRVRGTEMGAVTDDDGLFLIPNVAVADVVLDVTAPDHNPGEAAVSAGASSAKVTLVTTLEAPPETPPAVASRAISGKVTEQGSGDAIPGAAIQVAGTQMIALTEPDGSFVLDGVPLGPVTLEVTSIGYEASTVTVAAGVGVADVSLGFGESEDIYIEGRAPVIVKTNLANGASVVNSADLNRVPAQTLEGALQGKISGANMQANSGAPGGGAQIRLRGISTINGQSSPLFVVDGVIVSNVAVTSGANSITAAAGGGNPRFQDDPVNRIADLNPADIETVEVLKGSSAAALYGSKAANGVVIITTKRGRPGRTTVNVTQRFGFSQISNKFGSRKWTEADLMQAITDGAMPASALDEFRKGFTYDHEEEVSQSKLATETLVTASGGTERANYIGSIAVRDEPGIIIGTGYEKQSARVGVGYDLGDRLKINLTSNLIHSVANRGLNNNDNAGVTTYVALSSTPSFQNMQPVNGVYPNNPFANSNPLANVHLLETEQDTWRLIGAINANLKLISSERQSLTLVSNFGTDRFQQHDEILSPNELQFEDDDQLLGTHINASTENLNYNLGAGLVYTITPASGSWKSATSGGLTYEYTDLLSTFVIAQNLIAGNQSVDAGTVITTTDNRLRTKDQGVYVQEEVALLEDRLSLLAGLLGERSSLNGDTDKLFLFPKVAATYSVPGLDNSLDLLRVRGAFGQAGNRPNYGQRFTALDTTNNIGGQPAIITGGVAGDADIEPERQTEFEFGIDVAAKNQRAVLELTGYQRSISNLLLERTLAPSTGFTTQFFNGGSLRNRGVEAALQVTPVAADIEWTTRGTFTLNRSKITDLPEGIQQFDIAAAGFGTGLGANRIQEGQSATNIVGAVGLDANGDEIVAIVGNGEPDFRVGWSNNLTYKDFGLTTLLDWQKGSDIVNLTRLLYDGAGNSPDPVQGAERFASFRPRHDIRPYIEDASFVKLREVSLFWDVPAKFAQQVGPLDTLRLTLSGRNLLTISDYSGLDPEVSNFGNQPIGRNYDVAPYPPSRSFWFSLDAGF